MLRKKIALLSSIIAALAVVGVAQADTTTTAVPVAVVAPRTPIITPDVVNEAGFTKAAPIAPVGTSFQSPVYYFTVKETVPATAGWGSTSNVVAVLVVPKPTADWQFDNGQMDLENLNGRAQARLSTAKHYIVVTGPDVQKVSTLAHNLSVLY